MHESDFWKVALSSVPPYQTRINICVQVSVWLIFLWPFSCCKYLEAGGLDHFALSISLVRSLQSLCYFALPPAEYESSSFSVYATTLAMFPFDYFAFLFVLVSPCGFNIRSPVINDVLIFHLTLLQWNVYSNVLFLFIDFDILHIYLCYINLYIFKDFFLFIWKSKLQRERGRERERCLHSLVQFQSQEE